MSATKFLKVVDRQDKKDSKEGRDYCVLTLQAVNDKKVRLPNGQVIIAKGVTITGKIVAFDNPYLDNVDHDPNFDLKVGDYVQGAIVKRKVETYVIDGTDRTANTYQCVVLGDTADEEAFELEVARTFRLRDRILLTDNATAEVVEDTMAEEVEETADDELPM